MRDRAYVANTLLPGLLHVINSNMRAGEGAVDFLRQAAAAADYPTFIINTARRLAMTFPRPDPKAT